MGGLHFDITGDNSNFLRKLEEARNGVATTSKKIEESGMSIERLYSRMTTAAASFGVALSAKEIVSNVVRVRGEFQQLEVAFNTMLGSEEKAGSLMAQLVDTAAKTPFDLQGVANGAKQLLAYGTEAENVNDTLVRLGDIAAGLSIPLNDLVWLYGTTMTQGRLFTQDLRQFQGRGIPLADELAKQFGVAKDKVGELVTAGRVGFPEVQKAIEAMTNEGGKFGGLMDAQSKTITGQISNIEDAIDTMYNNIGKSSEGFINDALSGVSYLVENYEEIGKIVLELVGTYGAYKAVLITITALQKINSAVVTQAAFEQQFAAMTGHKLSDAQALAAAKTKLLTIAQQGLIKSLKSAGAALVANPYIIAAAAIAGMSLAIYKVVTAESEFDKATKRLNEANSDVEKSLASEVSKLTSLERKLSETKRGTEEYNRIKKSIVDNYGQYYKGLDGEIERVGNLSTAYGQLVEKMRLSIGQRKFESFFKAEQDNLDNLIGEKLDKAYDALIEKYGNDKGAKLYQQVFDYAIRGTSMPVDTWKQLSEATFNEWGFDNSPVGFAVRSVSSLVGDINKVTQASSKALDDFKAKYQMTDKDVENILSGNSISADNVDFSTISKEISDATAKIATLKQELADLRSGKTTVEVGETVQSVIETKVKELKTAEDALATLTGKDKSSDKKAEDERKKQLEKQKAIYRELLDLRLQNQQSEIDLMKEGSAKKIAQINLDYDNEIAAILTMEKEWKDAQGGKLTKEQTVEIHTALVNSYVKRERSTSNVNKEQLEEEKRAMNEYLKEYGSYLDKRDAITALYNEKIAKATTEGERKSLSEAMKRELSDLDIEASKTTSAISRLFGDMKDKTLSELEAINRKGREALEFLKSGVWDESKGKDFGITKETFELWSKSPDKLKDISDALKENKEAADKLRPAYEKVAKGLKGVFEAGSDTKKLRQAIDDIEEGLGEITRSGQFLSDTFSKLGDSFGGAFGEIAEGLNVAMDAVNSAMDGAKAGAMFGPIGASAGAAIGVVTSLASSIAKIHDKKNESRIQRLQDQIDTLDKSYDKLGRSIEKAYSKDASKLIDQQNKLLEQQKVLIQNQIKEEEDKKKTDNDRIKEWRDQIDEINNTIADNKEAGKDAIFGSDIKSAIDDFANAYADAWAAGEDKARSAKDLVRKMIRNMVTESIKAAASDPMKEIREKLLEFWSDDYISDWEQDYLDRKAQELADDLDRKFGWADKYFNTGNAVEEDDGRTASSKGVGSISQDSADVIDGKMSTQLIFLDRTLVQVTGIADQMRFIYDLQTRGWKNVEAIKDLSGKVSENTAKVAEISGRIEALSEKIEANTKSAASGIKTINDKGILMRSR
ncbi:tape measure protein [Parabacteroides sp.]